jgi:hypothetical protein
MSVRDELLNDQAATTCWNQFLRSCGFRVNPYQFELVPGRLNNRQASICMSRRAIREACEAM